MLDLRAHIPPNPTSISPLKILFGSKVFIVMLYSLRRSLLTIECIYRVEKAYTNKQNVTQITQLVYKYPD